MVEDLLELAVDYARRLGASYSEARYQRDSSQRTVLKNGVPEFSSDHIEQGMGVRVLVDGALAFASTSELTRASVRKAVKNAIALARASANRKRNRIEFSDDKVERSKVVLKPRIPFDNVDTEARVELLREADNNAVETAERKGVKLVSRLLEVGCWVTEKHSINSDGGDVRSLTPRATADYFIVAIHQQRGSIQRFENLGEARGWEAVERWMLPERLAEETHDIAEALLRGEEPPREPVDLLLGPEIVGLVCHESAGHPGEADRMLGREAAQAGETYIKPELLGTRIGSEHVTIVDDPTLPHSFGYYLYDEECVKAGERILIENGVLKELLHNRETAKKLGTRSNASARANAFDREPIVRMANTYMKPGDYTVEEMISEVRDGVYVKSYQEWNIDDKRWNQRYVGVVAYRIRNGETTGLVRNPVVDLTTRGLYSSVAAVGKDLKFYAGYCGKGDPMQAIPVWFGGPTILLKNIRIGFRKPT